MGLDWCVKDKVKPTMEASVAFANAQLDKINKEMSLAWESYVAESDEDNNGLAMHVFPNPVYTKFQETSMFLELRKQQTHWEDVRSLSVVSAMETLNAPRIGHDDEATAFAKNQYQESDKLQEEYATVEDFLSEKHGLYVPQLVSSDGIGLVSGIFAGEESFRGKVIANLPILKESDFDENCFMDRNPAQLIELGEALDKAARSCGDREDSEDEEIKEQLDVIRAASAWCLFWGERGHGMQAWY